MNYLAHLLLADDTDASRIGNLLGDFVRGSISQLAETYPTEVVRGIKMHRAVDRFTDSHALFKDAKLLLAPERRRFAGVIVDILFDYYLCQHWKTYCRQPLAEFCQEVYRALDKHPEWRAGRLAKAFPTMKMQDWLTNYSHKEGIALTLRRVSQRTPRVAPIAQSVEDFHQHHDEFEQIFLAYMPELIEFVREWKISNE
ncbi:MAG: ACP phosphodiesterase [Akkermansiaceae bacterium]